MTVLGGAGSDGIIGEALVVTVLGGAGSDGIIGGRW